MKFSVKGIELPKADASVIEIKKILANRLGLVPNSFIFNEVLSYSVLRDGHLVKVSDFEIETNEFIRDTSISFAIENEKLKDDFETLPFPIVISGSGLSGLYAALFLLRHGNQAILVEKGKPWGISSTSLSSAGPAFGGHYAKSGGVFIRDDSDPFSSFVYEDVKKRLNFKNVNKKNLHP